MVSGLGIEDAYMKESKDRQKAHEDERVANPRRSTIGRGEGERENGGGGDEDKGRGGGGDVRKAVNR